MPKYIKRIPLTSRYVTNARNTTIGTKPHGHRVLVEPGHKYKIKYHLKARKEPYEAILCFIGTGMRPIQNCLIFARFSPIYGDMILDRDEIIDVIEVDYHIPIYWNKPIGTYQWEKNGLVQSHN